MSVLDQKEYLKKYLSIGKAPGEKKKKKKKKVVNRVKIIDDDVEANLTTTIIEDDPLQVNEDAPQIVAVIDERPPSMRTDDKTNNPLWRPIGQANNDEEDDYKPIIAELKKAPKSVDKQYEHLFKEPPSKKSKHQPSLSKKKMEKTLDGKTAGLQNAKELAEETKQFRSREDEMFKSLNKEVSGESADTVHRDRKTGRIRNLEEEQKRQKEKNEEEEKQKEKYSRWGRGLAQVENRDQQIQEQLYEMSKPLARYADDEDLEKYLKDQEREGDPMLAYLRSKRRKKDAKKGKLEKPKFEGEFMPNRYGIRPGHRWDGVDRSNGYEKKWFEVQNEKKAQQEESYKWSTEDM